MKRPCRPVKERFSWKKCYLLPCRCGKQYVVKPRQSGEALSCPCGTILQIPTLLEMKTLEPAPNETSTSSKTAWGWRQRLTFLGVVLVLVAIALGVAVWLGMKPVPPIDAIDPEKLQQSAQQLPPLKTWMIWDAMKRQGLGYSDTRYAEALLKFHIFLTATIVLALVGIALLAIGISRPKSK